MITDPIADLLTRIRNAQRVGHRSVDVLGSKMAERVLTVLRTEGFVESFEKVTEKHIMFRVALKYYGTGEPVMTDIKRVSKPGRRVYSTKDKIPRVHSGLGIAILSTSQGVMSDREARHKNVGGEILAVVG